MSEDDEESRDIQLEWRDYVAIVIAMFETVLVPILVAVAVIIGLSFLIVFG